MESTIRALTTTFGDLNPKQPYTIYTLKEEMGFVFGGKLNFGLAFEMPKISIGCFVSGFFFASSREWNYKNKNKN